MTTVSGRYKSFKTLLRRGSMRFLRILHGFSRRTHLKYLLNMPDSIKVALGIEQLRTGNLLFAGHSSKSVSNDCSEFRLLKFAKPKCQWRVAKATLIKLGIFSNWVSEVFQVLIMKCYLYLPSKEYNVTVPRDREKISQQLILCD